MMRNHEAIIHFPIALFITAFAFALIGLFYRRGLFKELVFWNLIFGIVATFAAIYTGLIEQDQISDRRLDEALELHKRNAYICTVLILGLTSWLGFRKREMKGLEYIAWIAFFFIGSSSIVYQGYMGHEMSAQVRDLEIKAARAKSMPKHGDYGWNF